LAPCHRSDDDVQPPDSTANWIKVEGNVSRQAGISEATFYNWRHRYGGLAPSEMKRLRQLEEENGELKKLVADLSLDKAMLQDVIRRKI
jgi:putative transposase